MGKKRTLEILRQAGLKQAFTVSSITVTDVTVQVRYKLRQCQIPHSGKKKNNYLIKVLLAK